MLSGDIREQLLKGNPGTMMTWSPRHQTWVVASVTNNLTLSPEWGVALIGSDGKLPRRKAEPEYRELIIDNQLICLIKSKS